jgi:DNA invertase Pin-like site-specific DNA recombinase
VRLPDDQIAKIVARYHAGERAYVLADEFGVDRTRIPDYLKRAGVEKRPRSLSPQQIAQAAELYATGLSLTDVGTQLGLNRSTIHKAFQREGIDTRPSTRTY